MFFATFVILLVVFAQIVNVCLSNVSVTGSADLAELTQYSTALCLISCQCSGPSLTYYLHDNLCFMEHKPKINHLCIHISLRSHIHWQPHDFDK